MYSTMASTTLQGREFQKFITLKWRIISSLHFKFYIIDFKALQDTLRLKKVDNI